MRERKGVEEGVRGERHIDWGGVRGGGREIRPSMPLSSRTHSAASYQRSDHTMQRARHKFIFWLLKGPRGSGDKAPC